MPPQTHKNHCARLATPPADTTRKQFVADIRGRFRPIRGRIRHFASVEDGFDLRDTTQQARLADGDDTPDDWPDPPEEVYRFETAAGKADAFAEWLRGVLRDDVLEQTSAGRIRRIRQTPTRRLPEILREWDHWTATYVRAAYRTAWEAAGGRLRVRGAAVAPTQLEAGQDLAEAFNIGVSPDTLRRAYTRTYENLESIADDAAADAVRETITQGIAEGVNPRTMADRLTKDVRTLQHTRAETLARTETMATYSDSTLDRYEAAGADGVAHGEWSATNDARTCPVCKSLDGNEYTIEEMRTGTFTYEPSGDEPDHLAGEYALKPPAHPNGRCSILPVINS